MSRIDIGKTRKTQAERARDRETEAETETETDREREREGERKGELHRLKDSRRQTFRQRKRKVLN